MADQSKTPSQPQTHEIGGKLQSINHVAHSKTRKEKKRGKRRCGHIFHSEVNTVTLILLNLNASGSALLSPLLKVKKKNPCSLQPFQSVFQVSQAVETLPCVMATSWGGCWSGSAQSHTVELKSPGASGGNDAFTPVSAQLVEPFGDPVHRR